MAANADVGGDDDVVDYTRDPDEEREELEDNEDNAVRLSGAGINVRDFLERRDGVLFEPEIDESLFRPREREDYFANCPDDAEFDRRLASLGVGANGDGDGDDGENFEEKAARMTDINGGGGIKKRTTFRGDDSSGLPPERATVTLHYSLYVESQDEPFDSTLMRNKMERFRLDDGRMLVGVEMAVKTMRKKEKADFLIPWTLAYGAMGCPPRVPAKATILAQIELVDFVHEAAADALLAIDAEERGKRKKFDEILKVVRVEYVEGNELTKQKEFKLAARRYFRGIKLLDEAELRDEAEEKTQKSLLLKLLLNKSYCSLKMHWPKRVCLDLQRVLNMSPRNEKALYRMALAKRQLGSLEDALSYLTRAKREAPRNVDIGQELKDLAEKIRRQQVNERLLCMRMMGVAGEGAGTGAGQARRERQRLAKEVDDEMRGELVEHLTGFMEDPEQTVMPLPASLGPAELAVIEGLCEEHGLRHRVVHTGGAEHWEVFKGEQEGEK